jgi:hypothetical protein
MEHRAFRGSRPDDAPLGRDGETVARRQAEGLRLATPQRANGSFLHCRQMGIRPLLVVRQGAAMSWCMEWGDSKFYPTIKTRLAIGTLAVSRSRCCRQRV